MVRESVIAAAVLFVSLGCGGTEPEPLSPERLRHVELFGYYQSSGHLEEMLPYSNMVWGRSIAAVDLARTAGIRAIVDVQHIFRISASARPTAEVVEAEWREFAARLAPHLSAVAALYPSDEPYWNGSRNGVPFDEVRRRLEEAARMIRATPGYEHVPIATIFADPELDWIASGKAANPAGYDWVGFDLYFAPIWLLQQRTALFLWLLRPEQRVIAVPDAMLPTSAANDLGVLRRRVEYWLSWVAETPQVIAIAPFIYWTGGDSTLAWIGARELPPVRDRYAEVGSWIVEGSAARAAESAQAKGVTGQRLSTGQLDR